MNKYVGIADCHGVESFIEYEEAVERGIIPALYYRASANRHRHAVVYMLDIDDSGAKTVRSFLEMGMYQPALLYLKRNAKNIQIEKGFHHCWERIPNDELDPYYKGDEEIKEEPFCGRFFRPTEDVGDDICDIKPCSEDCPYYYIRKVRK